MIEVTMSREVSSSIDNIWDIITNEENEQKYWTALKNIKILSRNGNRIEREATIKRGPFGNAKSLQTLVLDPEEKAINLTLTKGPMLGTRKITLSRQGGGKTKVEVDWQFELKGVPGFAHGFVKDNISEVTEKALGDIAREAEQSSVVASVKES